MTGRTGLPLPPPDPPGFGAPPAPPRRRRARLVVAAGVAAILVAVAALVIGVIALTRPAAPVASSPATSESTSEPTQDTADADRALCTAIAPLMAENHRVAQAYTDLGPGGSPERDAATPKYISDMRFWITRIRPIVKVHPDVDPFFHRSLQRFIDDQRLFIDDISAGPYMKEDDTMWADRLAAYNGPVDVCSALGITW